MREGGRGQIALIKVEKGENMRELEGIVESEREYLSERVRDLGVREGEMHSYYQGRIDALNWVLNQLSEGARI